MGVGAMEIVRLEEGSLVAIVEHVDDGVFVCIRVGDVVRRGEGEVAAFDEDVLGPERVEIFSYGDDVREGSYVWSG